MARYLLSFRGTLAAGSLAEIFSHSLAINSVAPASTVAADAVTDWRAAFNGGAGVNAGCFPTSTIYTEAVVAEILNLELGTLKSAFHAPFTPPLAGTSVGRPMPSQAAIAVSLTAGTYQNGVPLKGRFYLPTPASQILGTDGLIGSTELDAITSAMATFLDAMNDHNHIPSVWSRYAPKHGGGTIMNTVTSLRVGNKIDTVRRRRNAKIETYNVTAIAP